MLSASAMVYRIDTLRTQNAVELAFQGVLNEAALADVLARIVATPGPVRLVLRAGTEVDARCIDALRRLPVTELRAESPYLQHVL